MKTNKTNLNQIILTLLVLAIIYLAVNIIGDNEIKTIRKNLCIVTSTIKKVGSGGYRGSYSKLYVEFYWKNEVIKADFSSPNPKCNVVSSQLLLAVDSTNIESSVLLLKPEDFEEFNPFTQACRPFTRTCGPCLVKQTIAVN